MARKPTPGARDRLLDSAAQLFREHGIRAVGLQQVIDSCGCGKNLLYREFASKDDLVIAYLGRCHDEWTAAIDAATRPVDGDPAAQIVAIVRAVATQISAPDYHGCPTHNAQAEYPEAAHPVHRAAVANQTAVRDRIAELAERAGAADPQLLADRIMLIVDGLYANGALLGGRAAAGAVAFADEVVRAATGSSAPLSAAS